MAITTGRLHTRIQALPFSKKAAAAVSSIAIIGTVFVLLSFAASSLVLEAESATRSGGATVVDDGAASGGKALKFTKSAIAGSSTTGGSNTGSSDGSATGSNTGSSTGTGSGSGASSSSGGIGSGTIGADGTLSGSQYFCVQPNAGQGGDGVRLLTQNCDSSEPQVVNYIAANDKEGGMIRFKASSLCMVAAGANDNAQVKMANCDHANDAMRWISNDDNSLQNAESGKCLRPQGGATGSALYLEVTSCNNPVSSPNQLWCLPNTCNGSVGDSITTDGRLMQLLADYCAQPNAGVGGIGIRLVTETCGSSASQKVQYIVNSSAGTGMIRFKSSYLCMWESGSADLSQVQLAKCNAANKHMRWSPLVGTSSAGNVYAALKNAESGKCLRPKGGATGPSLYLEVTSRNMSFTSPNQAWDVR